jgi:monofunctional biosynthetic peptidoglycan transglycosylase
LRVRFVRRAILAPLAVAFACAAYLYLTLPDVRPLRTRPPASTAFIELRAREARSKGKTPRRFQRWVPYSRISQNLRRAVLVAEDSSFWQHDGIDFQQIQASMDVNLERMEFARGGSTITQQLAKNLYLTPSKNPLRKLRELLIARRLEAELSKPRILELYLNVIEWGDGIYGAEAASQTYFHKAAADLDISEAALLAGAISSPRSLDAAHPNARLRQRQRMIMRRMHAVAPQPVVTDSDAPAPIVEAPAAPPARTRPQPVFPGQIVAPARPAAVVQ